MLLRQHPNDRFWLFFSVPSKLQRRQEYPRHRKCERDGRWPETALSILFHEPRAIGRHARKGAFRQALARAAAANAAGRAPGMSRITAPKRRPSWSTCSSLCAAERLQRSRQAPLGVPGGTARFT